jgi:hypothetical protein
VDPDPTAIILPLPGIFLTENKKCSWGKGVTRSQGYWAVRNKGMKKIIRENVLNRNIPVNYCIKV